VVAIECEPAPIRLSLSGREVIEAGDPLVVIGPRSDLQSLAQQAQAPSA
jgi:hypothetical protein